MTALAFRAQSLGELEATIERGLATFVEVGQALASIRELRLYRETHPTFEAYCRERWGWSRQRANQQIAAAAIAGLLTTTVVKPKNEAVARELATLADEPEKMREVWAEAVERHGPEPTAAEVREVVGRDKMAVHYTSDSPEWYTPRPVIDATIALFGTIDLDPCSNSASAPNVPASHHLTAGDDGLAHDWNGRVYMNPPYGDEIGKWTMKLREEFERGAVTEGVALVPARTDTRWFCDLRHFALCFVDGRLRFSESANSAPFPSAVIYLGPNVAGFADAFAFLGRIYVPYV